MQKMRINYLSDNWPWFGKHQCYGRLVDYVKKIESETKDVRLKYGIVNKILGKAHSFFSGDSWRKDYIFSAAEYRYLRQVLNAINPQSCYHILFFDTHYPMFKRWQKAPRNVIATIHHPIGRKYPYLMEDSLKCLSSAIVMFSEGVEYFEQYVGKGRVRFIHYGVDTDFFRPKGASIVGPKRIFFTGRNGRNIAMLKRVILKLLELYPDLQFDLLIPEAVRYGAEIKELNDQARIAWYVNLPEEEVRKLYQRSYLLLMPMEDSGVNTAIVEALACGLPVVTTDVGGIRDYGGGTIYPIVKNNDDDAMIALVEQYLKDENWRNEVARKGRVFAENNLAWDIIAQKHLEVYKELAG